MCVKAERFGFFVVVFFNQDITTSCGSASELRALRGQSYFISTVCTLQRTFFIKLASMCAVPFRLAFRAIQSSRHTKNPSRTFCCFFSFIPNIRLIAELFWAHYLPFRHDCRTVLIMKNGTKKPPPFQIRKVITSCTSRLGVTTDRPGGNGRE